MQSCNTRMEDYIILNMALLSCVLAVAHTISPVCLTKQACPIMTMRPELRRPRYGGAGSSRRSSASCIMRMRRRVACVGRLLARL